MLTIGFRMSDEFGNEYSQDSTVDMAIFSDAGDTELDVFGRQFNCFLRQCGYVRNNENIFMEDVTDEECVAISDFLEELREVNK